MPFENVRNFSTYEEQEKAIKARLVQLQSDLDANVKVVKELEDKTSILEVINSNIIKANSEADDIKANIKTNKDKISNLDKTIEIRKEEIIQLNIDYCLKKEQYKEDIDLEKKKLNEEVRLIEKKVKVLQKNRDDLFKEIEELKQGFNSLHSSFLSLLDEKNDIDGFIKENKSILENIEKNKSIESDTNKSLAKIKTNIQEAFIVLSGLETEIKQKDEATVHLSKDIFDLQSKKVQIETEMISRESLISQREFSVNEKEKKIKAIMAQLRVISPEKMVNINI